MDSPVSSFTQRAASRLKFPQLFGLLLALFVFDVVFPDFVPFVDEILLALATTLFGLWREKVPGAQTPTTPGTSPASPASPAPPIKNVTPPA